MLELSDFLFPICIPLIAPSKFPFYAKEVFDVEKIIGPLLFLKIEGDRHFFPYSKSFISNNLYLFFVSVSEGRPLLFKLSCQEYFTVVFLKSTSDLQSNVIIFYAVSLPPVIKSHLRKATYIIFI